LLLIKALLKKRATSATEFTRLPGVIKIGTSQPNENVRPVIVLVQVYETLVKGLALSNLTSISGT